MRRHRSGVDGIGRVKEGLLAGGRTRIYTGASAWRSRGVQGLVIWPEKSPRRTVFQFGPQNWVWGPSAARQPGGFPGLGLKTWSGVRCGRTAKEGFLVWASKPGVAPGAAGWPGGFGSLGLKTTKAAGFSVWASKPRMALDAVEWPGGFGGLASKPSPTRVSRF